MFRLVALPPRVCGFDPAVLTLLLLISACLFPAHTCLVGAAQAGNASPPPVHDGWPQGGIEPQFPVFGSPQIVDLEGDGTRVLVVATGFQNVWREDGSELIDGDGDPGTVGPFSSIDGFSATQAIADVDVDGDLEIANVSFETGELYLWHHDGSVLPGFPVSVMDDFNIGSPVLADLDDDGDLEVIVWSAHNGRLFAWHHDGTEVADGDGNPATIGVLARIFGVAFNYSSPAVCDLDGDPELEIVFAVNLSSDQSGGVYAVNPDGSFVPGWPFLTGDMSHPSRITASPAVADIDGDTEPEIVIAAESDGGLIYVLEPDGTVHPDWPVAAPVSGTLTASPVVVDLDGNAELDIVYPDSDGWLHAFDRFGHELAGFPVVFATDIDELPQTTMSTPVVGDIDGDGSPEILFGDQTGELNGYAADGTIADGFPILFETELRSSPAIWDLDLDGLVEIAAATSDAVVTVWDLPGGFSTDGTPWPFFRRDAANTGCVEPLGSTAIAAGGAGSPQVGVLLASLPNPFNPFTRIRYRLPGNDGVSHAVKLTIHDTSGRLVRRLVDGTLPPGDYSATWDGRSDARRAVASGAYFVRLHAGDVIVTRKLTLLR